MSFVHFLYIFVQHGQISVEDMLTMTYSVVVSFMKVGLLNIHVLLTNVNKFVSQSVSQFVSQSVSQFSTLTVRFG